MGRRVSRWAGCSRWRRIVAACSGAAGSSAPPAPSGVARWAGGPGLSPAGDDDPGDPAGQPVRPAPDGHDHRRQPASSSPGRRSRSTRGRSSRTCRLGRSPTPASRRSWTAGGTLGMFSGERRLRAARRDARRLARADRDRGRRRAPRPERRSVAGHRLRHDAVRPGARDARGVRRVLGVALRPDLARRRPGSQRRRTSPTRTPCSSACEPVDDPAIRPAVAIWPLEQPIATLGKPVGSAPTPRCGTVRGADATTLRPSLEAANQLTRWVDEGADRADATAIQVRPMVPGEDVCLEVFGLSE